MICLRPLRPGDEEAAVRWSEDPVFCRANDWELDLPPERVCRHWRGLIEAPPPDFVRLGIERGGRLIGYGDWASITPQSAELGLAIGESRLWGQGLGVEAGRLLIAYAFGVLGLPQVRAEVHAPNTRSRRLMPKLGFREVGVVGEETYGGQPTPLIGFTLSREDWNALSPKPRG